MNVRQQILSSIRRVASEQNRALAPIADELPLVNTGLDSLSFAVLVANLEEELGVDPFAETENIEPPVTIGDFVKLYEDALKVE